MPRSHPVRSGITAVFLVSVTILTPGRSDGQSSIIAAVAPAAVAEAGGPATIGYPYAVRVRIQGWTSAANSNAYVKLYSGSYNEFMWTGNRWSRYTQFADTNQPVVPIDGSGNWSGWIYAKHNADIVGTLKVRAAKVGDTGIKPTDGTVAFSFLTMTPSGNGGWISRGASPAVNKPIVAFSGGVIVGSYRSEDNTIAEGYTLAPGGFRIAVPAGMVDSLVAMNDDGSVFLSFAGPWSVAAGLETDAAHGGTAFGKGRAAVFPSSLQGGIAQTIAVRVYGESPATLTATQIIAPHPWSWSRTPADVSAPGTVMVTGDTIRLTGLNIQGTDSTTVTISNIVPADSTTHALFHVSTGVSADSLLPIAAQPSVFVYSTPIPIAFVKENDGNGIPLRNNTMVTVRGIVTVANEFGGPSYVQDNSGGLAVFGSAFSTAVAIGDEVVVSGTVQPFAGLTEIVSPTIHQTVGRGNTVEPFVVTAAQVAADGQGGVELYEGRLLRINGVTVSGSGSWAYTNYTLTDASGSTQVRIDNSTQLIGKPIPAGAFDIIGVGSQYITAPPFIGGYQVMPRLVPDIIAAGPIIATAPMETAITPSSLTVRWTTVLPGSSEARYGKTPALEMGGLVDLTLQTVHTLTIESLEPATVYYVRVYSVSGTDTSHASPLIASTASPAATTGRINVYFNHSVNSGVAWTEPAGGNRNLVQPLLSRLNSARRSIDVAVYSLSGTPGPGSDIANALAAARARGVRVRVVCESDNRNTAPFTILSNAGIPVIDDRYDAINAGAGLMHNKFFVLDGRGGAPESVWVVSGSWNPTQPGTFNDFQNVVEVQDPALAGAYTIEFNEMWGSDTDTPDASRSRFGARKTDNTPHRFIVNGVPVESYFSPSDRTTSRIQAVIDSARHSVAFALLTFTRTDLRTSIVNQKTLGRKVRGVMDNNTDSGNQYSALKSAGVDVLLKPAFPLADSLLHHKYAIIDGEDPGWNPAVVTGSHNWSNSAEASNNENTLIFRDGRVANLFLQEFAARYAQFGGADPIVVGVEAAREGHPPSYHLEQNYPNPFNGVSKVGFSTADLAWVNVSVFDVLGRQVAVLVNEKKGPGNYEVTWDAGGLPSGAYFCRLRTGNFMQTRRMTLIR